MSVWEDIKSACKKIAYVFTREYQDGVRYYAFLEKKSDEFRLNDSGTDMDEAIERLIKKGIKPNLHIDLNLGKKSPHQDFVSKLNPKQSLHVLLQLNLLTVLCVLLLYDHDHLHL